VGELLYYSSTLVICQGGNIEGGGVN